jgi:NAD(P)-dependent dehydrogenase (short-subunit alcohol dehydrogenase family)
VKSESMHDRESTIGPSCEGRVAVVTGAAGSGMGRSIALTLAREGAQVVVNYRTSGESAEKIVDLIQADGGCALAMQADIFGAQGCSDLIKTTVDRFGQVDICVIGPGGGWHPEAIDHLAAEGTLEDLHHEVDPIVHLMPLVLPGMYEHKWGRLIGIAMHPRRLSPAYAYNLGKAARLQALLLASEQAWPHGITVNIIAPGPVPALKTLEEAVDQCEHGVQWQTRSDVSPQDIAEGVAFLCSDAGAFITGCVVPYLFHG